MHIIVIGAGVIGVTTAYCLRMHGFNVTVIERNAAPAQETSFANAGVIAPAYIAPWAQPGMPRKLLSYLFEDEAPLVYRPVLDAGQWRWALRWLRECRSSRFKINRERMRRLALYSRAQLHDLRGRHQLEYEQTKGFLQLFRSDKDLWRAQSLIELLREGQVTHKQLTAEQCRALEPALADETPLAGGLHLPEDETGNCAFFTRQIKDLAAALGVQFRFDARVQKLHMAGGRVANVQLHDEALDADAVVVAAGVDSARLLKPLGVRVPLYPVKGYSLTATLTRLEFAPRIAIMDEAYKVAITPMGNRLRIAGTAELSDRGMLPRDSAIATLHKVARDWYPAAASYRQARVWVGARPMLPDGPPLLGSTPVQGLYLNLGHGSTGWAMACGSAQVVADVIAGKTPQIDLDGLTLARYRGS
jgi:D-amino-acid dehydrogenase